MHDLNTIQKLNRAEIDKARKTGPITPEIIFETLTDLVADFGKGYRYPKSKPGYMAESERKERCVYQLEDGTPACIIGHLIDRLGLELPVEKDSNETAFEVMHDALMNAKAAGREVFELEDGTASRLCVALRQAQYTQDHGGTWGVALYHARLQWDSGL